MNSHNVVNLSRVRSILDARSDYLCNSNFLSVSGDRVMEVFGVAGSEVAIFLLIVLAKFFHT